MKAHDAIAAITSASPAFPPSFDNDPWLFAWSLFARTLVLTLSAAWIVRLTSRNRAEGVTVSSPVFYHRMVVICFCVGALFSSSADTLTFLLWNEVSASAMAIVLTVTKVLQGLTMFPFLGALFVPFWMMWFRWSGLGGRQQTIRVGNTISDLKTTWSDGMIPFRLVSTCGMMAVVVSASKYAAWSAHVRH